MNPSLHIGHSRIRKEGRAKVTGEAQYTDDVRMEYMLYGVTVRSSVPRGILKGIEFGEGIPWDEFVIVTAKDVPGELNVALIERDQPFLALDRINHPEEPVVLLAHADRYLLEKARAAVHLDIEPLPPLFDLEESLACKEVIWGQDNLFKKILIEKGDVDSVWAGAAHVVEGEYKTGSQEQLYIEPNGAIAVANAEAGVTVWGSLQCPYYVHTALKALFNLPDDKVRVIQMETGGGFGGKEDYPSLIAGHAALLSLKAGGRPVKIVYDREEDMVATTKRHPSRTRIRSAFDAEGRLLALDIDFALDGGAYLTLSPVVLSRGAIHAGGPYRCPNTSIRARAAATNTPPHGAFRGFGAPQSLFAIERHMDVAAAQMGMDPIALRKQNLLRMGDATATGQIIKENVDLPGLLDHALEKLDYSAKKENHRIHNASLGPIKKGLGFAIFMHGCGFTGSGESYLASVAGVEGRADGKVHVLAASTEMGQGANTILSQVVAEVLKVPLEYVEVVRPDTALVPDSGPTVASRTTMVVGKLVQEAAIGLRQTLIQSGFLKVPYDGEGFSSAVKQYIAKNDHLKAYSQYNTPPQIVWDDQLYKGDAYTTFAWACYAAEVAVDTRTFEVKVEDFVAFQEVGRVLNPTLAEGQIEGGVAQGIGYGLSEQVVWSKGRMANGQMTNYIMATSMDIPRIRVYFEENPYPNGPGGAKGLGELPMDGPAPALLNAVQDALGTSAPREIPLTPERLMDLLDLMDFLEPSNV
ncbi:MAG: xanthine dehydrogenase family protein [Holophagaceae bacterium]|nr:xanthine dehydrogenase family protein [Holophagaceae bacterium]